MTKVNSFSSRAYFLKEHPDRVQKPCQGNFSVNKEPYNWLNQ